MALSLLQRALATARSKSESSPIAPLPFSSYCFPPTITADSLRGGVRRGTTPTIAPPADDQNFASTLMLAVTAGAFLVIAWVATKGLFFFRQESRIR
jgi:hypothetical protein